MEKHVCNYNLQNAIFVLLHDLPVGGGEVLGREGCVHCFTVGALITLNSKQNTAQIRGRLSRVKHRESPVSCGLSKCANLRNSKIEIFALINVT